MKLIPLIINRKRWLRGDEPTITLRNQDGSMCCLGFACRALGVSAQAITAKLEPDDVVRVATSERVAERLSPLVTRTQRNRSATIRAMTINDNSIMSEAERERKLAPVLKKLGFRVKFVGPKRDEA